MDTVRRKHVDTQRTRTLPGSQQRSAFSKTHPVECACKEREKNGRLDNMEMSDQNSNSGAHTRTQSAEFERKRRAPDPHQSRARESKYRSGCICLLGHRRPTTAAEQRLRQTFLAQQSGAECLRPTLFVCRGGAAEPGQPARSPNHSREPPLHCSGKGRPIRNSLKAICKARHLLSSTSNGTCTDAEKLYHRAAVRVARQFSARITNFRPSEARET